MGKTKKISKQQLIRYYMQVVLEREAAPKSVYQFAKDNGFEESVFYQYFTSFDTLKDAVFTSFFENAMTLLQKSDEFENYDARARLLAFYYTIFEIFTANRSYILLVLYAEKNKLKTLKQLRSFEKLFENFVATLEIEKLKIKQKRLEKLQNQILEKGAWGQFLITLKFWLEDTSPSFQKTDIFIEKSVNASFDLLSVTPLKSVIDLGKFWVKEKVMPS